MFFAKSVVSTKIRVAVKLLLLFNLTLLSCSSKNTSTKVDKPNIILIYADDLGIGLLGHEGQKIISTPNIDKLAKEGIRFENAYSNMLCAPARASLISGRHDCHQDKFEITRGGLYKKISTSTTAASTIEKSINSKLSSVPTNQVFLGEVAQSQGYKTAQFGKLEWGFSATDKQMKRHGWDYYLGYLDHVRAHGFYPPFLFENGDLKEYQGNTLANAGKSGEPETEQNFKERWNMDGKNSYSQDIFMQGIHNFIEDNKDEPFFLYFPTQLPHGPVSIPKVHPDFINNKNLTQIEKEYASMVKLLDDNVGAILKQLKQLNIDQNTIVIFTSDNGHEIYYSLNGRVQKPYTNIKTGERFDDYDRKYYSELEGDVFNGNGGRAGMKRSNLQGGINVPLIVRWPAKIKENSTSKRLVANYDIVSTIAAITGYSKPFTTDGISFYNELLQISDSLEHNFVVYSSYTGPTLITKEGWKLRTYISKSAFELYYLPDDFKEEKDLSMVHPEKMEALKKLLIQACDGDLNNGHFSYAKNIMENE